jgi:uncharacterized protein (DUF697 family)
LILLPTSRRQIDATVVRCRELVGKRALISAGAALLPVPALDFAADVGLLVQLIHRINYEFGLTPDQIERLEAGTKVLLFQAMVGIGGAMIGRTVTADLVCSALRAVGARVSVKQSAKFVPVAGQILAAAVGYGSLRYVGERHIQDCVRVVSSLVP